MLCCAPLRGIDRDRKLDQLHHTGWTFKEGAPSEIHALAQTTDGYLWLGTASGLFRFDGLRFQKYQPPPGQDFQQRQVYSLFATPDGGLLVGYWFGGVSFLKDGKVINYGKQDGLPSHAVLAFARDRNGTIWIAAGRDGLARLEGSRWKKVEGDWGPNEPANTVFVGHNGTVWVGTSTRIECLSAGATHFQIVAKNLHTVMKFAEAPDGTVWMAETGRGVRPVPLPWRKNSAQNPEIVVGSQAITIDDQGSLWIASLGDGIIRAPYPEHLTPSKLEISDARLQVLTQRTDLTADYVTCVLQDREGNIWFGTHNGLDQLRQSAIVSLPLPGGSSARALVPGKEGSLWVSSVGPNYLIRFRNDEVSSQRQPLYFDSAYRDPRGFIWLAAPGTITQFEDENSRPGGSNRSGIAYRYHSGVPALCYQRNAGECKLVKLRVLDLPSASGAIVNSQSRVSAMTSDESGRLWICTSSGIFRLEESGWTSLDSLGGPQGTARLAFTDSEGRIWFGFKNEIAMLKADKVTLFSGSDGVRVGTVESIAEEGARIWIGGEAGVQYFDESHFQSIESADGSALDGVFGIVADPRTGLWLATNQAIVFLARPELQRLNANQHRVTLRTFGLLDGLAAALLRNLASPSSARTSDGRIWFATTNGLAWIDPNRIPNNTVPPAVVIESLVANGRQYDTFASLTLAPQTENLRIVYTATSLAIPERVQFRYKLDGQDKAWQEPGTRREAIYTNLNPGSYRFHVVACNNDGLWNDTGAAIAFTILPTWYQMGWFRTACVALTLFMLLLGYRLRLQEVARSVSARFDERLAERMLIARELHDTLLQTIQASKLISEHALELRDDPQQMSQAVEKLSGWLGQAVLEGRSALNSLRNSAQPTNDLMAAFEQAAHEGIAPGLMEIDLEVVGQSREMHPIVRDEIYRIGCEAIHNAFLHSSASRLEIKLQYGRDLLIQIRDDGIGMPSDIASAGKPSHFGLTGMRERASRIKADLQIASSPRSGTSISLHVPGNVAFTAKGFRRRLVSLMKRIRRNLDL